MKHVKYPVPKMAKIIKALGHPLRLQIVLLLKGAGSMSVKQIHHRLGVTQPEVSKQLTVLRNATLLSCRRKKGFSFYELNRGFVFIDTICEHTR